MSAYFEMDDDPLQSSGYFFDKDGVLLKRETLTRFTFQGQLHYERLGDAVIQYIEKILLSKYRTVKVVVPQQETEHFGAVVHLSPNFYDVETIVLIIQGSGAVRPGMWARALCINEGLTEGTAFGYLDRITSNGWGFALLNPNDNRVGAFDLFVHDV